MDLNRVCIIGHIVSAPKRGAGNVASLVLATAWRVAGKEYVQFHPVVCSGKLADVVLQYVTKGSKVFVEGSLRHTTFPTRGRGRHKTTAEVVAENLILLSPRKPEAGR